MTKKEKIVVLDIRGALKSVRKERRSIGFQLFVFADPTFGTYISRSGWVGC